MTIRQCQIKGMQLAPDSAGIISMNGVEVFNGEFLAEINQPNVTLAGFSLDVDDALAVNGYVSVPTVITVTAGSMNFGLSLWNYAMVYNKVYTEEQRNIVLDPNTVPPARLNLYTELANPPLSAADIEILSAPYGTELEAKQAIKVAHNLTINLQNPEVFGIAFTDIVNRANVRLDGVEPTVANTNVGIAVNEGQVLTLDSLVFVSNQWMKT